MSYSIKIGKHSADKDHTAMTGGSLSVDKIVESESGVKFYTYEIEMYTGGNFDEEFHKGIHTAEHMIAYKKDTGSVRDSLEEISGNTIDESLTLQVSFL